MRPEGLQQYETVITGDPQEEGARLSTRGKLLAVMNNSHLEDSERAQRPPRPASLRFTASVNIASAPFGPSCTHLRSARPIVALRGGADLPLMR